MNAGREEWRPIPGYEGRYEVSDEGRVYSLLTNKFLKPIESGGYHMVALYNGGQRLVRINRLVLMVFIGDAPSGMISCHNDGDSTNNRLSNLRWDTYSSNLHDAVRHGNHVNANKTHCPRGHEYTEDNLRMKPSEGRRRCKTCIREYQRDYRSRKAA